MREVRSLVCRTDHQGRNTICVVACRFLSGVLCVQNVPLYRLLHVAGCNLNEITFDMLSQRRELTGCCGFRAGLECMTLLLFAGRVPVVVSCEHKKLLGSQRMKICLASSRVDFLVVYVSRAGVLWVRPRKSVRTRRFSDGPHCGLQEV